ncbi:class I SAM-dependent methyltransferase [Psychrosphaera ytuae]|nr:class I SAM-dependent methyltransferase [Psychrosphaera ytuae]
MTSQNQFYDDNAEQFFDSTVSVEMGDIYDRFLPYLNCQGTDTKGLVVDAGCGSGRDAKFYLNQGFEVYAFDASPTLAKKATEYLGQNVDVTTFDSFKINKKAQGIWCCASLLHVPRSALPQAINNIERHLASGGALYVSFKYGTEERIHNGRSFTDMNEALLADLFDGFSNFELKERWISADNRPDRQDEKWLNAIFIKR